MPRGPGSRGVTSDKTTGALGRRYRTPSANFSSHILLLISKYMYFLTL